MKANQSESPSDVWRWFQNQAASLGPAVLGSLSLRRSPCVRENCPACLSGEQHASYVLYGRLKGRRFAVYVPEELVPEVRRCLDNGRALRDLQRGLKNPGTGRNGLAPQQVLRSLILMRIKNWNYRELRERIADGYTLRQFTDFYCQPVPKHGAFNRAFNRLTPQTLQAVNE